MPACSSRPRLLPWSIAVAFVVSPAFAQWSQRPTSVTPPARSGATLTYLDSAHVAVLFGGVFAPSTLRNDTWLHDGIAWRQLQVQGPPARSGAAAAHDRIRSRVVLFGGVGTAGFLDDTWVFDGQRWQRLTTAVAPSPRFGAAMACDARRDRLVLYGGRAASRYGDTWEFDGSQWQQTTPTNTPPPLEAAAAAFDELRAQVVLFGGIDPTYTPRNELWSYDGSTWQQLGPANSGPTPRRGALMVADADRGVLTVHGGADLTMYSDTWEFDGVDWTLLAGSAPSPRSDAAMTFDRDRNRALLFGGSIGGNETWVLHHNPRPYAAPFGPSCDGRTLDSVNARLPEIGTTFTLDVAGAGGGSLVIGALGQSVASSGSVPLPAHLPVPNTSCWQLTDIAAAMPLPFTHPVYRWTLPIPANAALIGQEYYLQAYEFEPTAAGLVVHTSNAVDCRIGLSPRVGRATEDFTSQQQRDDDASSGDWGNGMLTKGLIGSDGRHGSFDPTIGTPTGAGVYVFDTGNQRIPGRLTMSGQPDTVTDGRFYFSDFVVPAGITVRFTGTTPPLITVRGRVEILGRIDLNAPAMTSFTSRAPARATVIPGQPGGLGGPGGGRGGRGGDRCLGNGPTIVGGVNMNDGARGETVQLPAGHAYAGNAVFTGGRGSPMFPVSGLMSAVVGTFQVVYSGQCAPGGSGGGFWTGGTYGSANTALPAIQAGAALNGGSNFGLGNYTPSGVQSIDFHVVGGSGGGGGGSHPFYAIAIASITDMWKAGAGGSGGGGAMAIRSGGDLTIGSTGALEARGGGGVNFPDRMTIGNACPGGGGSGGSLLLQSGTLVTVAGSIDTSGGPGSTIANVIPANAAIPGVLVQGGAGSPGTYLIESMQPAVTAGAALVPALDPALHLGTLRDRDAATGARSLFLPLPGANQDVSYCERYELDVDINGVPVRFSDDPTVGLPASDPLGPVVVRFQAGRLFGNTIAAAGPWRANFGRAGGGFDDLNRDLPTLARFDIVFTGAIGNVVVRAVRLYCR